jgi:hypothetical protein
MGRSLIVVFASLLAACSGGAGELSSLDWEEPRGAADECLTIWTIDAAAVCVEGEFGFDVPPMMAADFYRTFAADLQARAKDTFFNNAVHLAAAEVTYAGLLQDGCAAFAERVREHLLHFVRPYGVQSLGVSIREPHDVLCLVPPAAERMEGA